MSTQGTQKKTHTHTQTQDSCPRQSGFARYCALSTGEGPPLGVSLPHSRPRPSTALGCVLTGVGDLGLLLTVRAAVEEVGGHLPLALDLHHAAVLQLVAPAGQHIIQVCGDLWGRRRLMIDGPTFICKITLFHSSTSNHICICLLMIAYYHSAILSDILSACSIMQ